MKKNTLFVTIGTVVALVAALDVSPALAQSDGVAGPHKCLGAAPGSALISSFAGMPVPVDEWGVDICGERPGFAEPGFTLLDKGDCDQAADAAQNTGIAEIAGERSPCGAFTLDGCFS